MKLEGNGLSRVEAKSEGKYYCDVLYVNFVAFSDVICHLIKAASLTGACCFTNSRALFLG